MRSPNGLFNLSIYHCNTLQFVTTHRKDTTTRRNSNFNYSTPKPYSRPIYMLKSKLKCKFLFIKTQFDVSVGVLSRIELWKKKKLLLHCNLLIWKSKKEKKCTVISLCNMKMKKKFFDIFFLPSSCTFSVVEPFLLPLFL